VLVIDTQNERPKHRIQLKKVGIKGLKTFFITDRSGVRHHYIPTVELTIDLPAEIKGIHMSRLVESMTEVISEEFSVHDSVEDLQIRILNALFKKHSCKWGEIKFDFEFGYETKTPASQKRTWEICDVTASTVMAEGRPTTHSVEIEVIGNTVCPHCMANNEQGLTHMQRAIGSLRVVGEPDQIPNYGQMIEIIENSFSSRTYSILKLEDEMQVTKQMHENPLFVEDVCRNILQHAKEMFTERVLEIYAEATSMESIHKHDVIAQGQIVVNGNDD
jgi:GTP cyclohydrolase-4